MSEKEKPRFWVLHIVIIFYSIGIGFAIAYPFLDDFTCIRWDCVEITTDSNGVQMIDYKNLAGLGIGKVYNPGAVDTSETPEWFLDRSQYNNVNGNTLLMYEYNWWLNSAEHGHQVVNGPFYSCESQSIALRAIIPLDEDFAYEVYEGLINPPLTEDYWMQGFWDEEIGGTYIMNSQLYCLTYVYDFYELTGDEQVLEFYMNGVERLEKEIDSFTTVNGTWYDRYSADNFKSHLNHPKYIEMLGEIADISNSEKLQKVYEHWNTEYKAMKQN